MEDVAVAVAVGDELEATAACDQRCDSPIGPHEGHGWQQLARSWYHGRLFSEAPGDIDHRFTRPYRPQTHGKLERFNRTMFEGVGLRPAYDSEQECAAAFGGSLHL